MLASTVFVQVHLWQFCAGNFHLEHYSNSSLNDCCKRKKTIQNVKLESFRLVWLRFRLGRLRPSNPAGRADQPQVDPLQNAAQPSRGSSHYLAGVSCVLSDDEETSDIVEQKLLQDAVACRCSVSATMPRSTIQDSWIDIYCHKGALWNDRM
jgi:hypothetical protein